MSDPVLICLSRAVWVLAVECRGRLWELMLRCLCGLRTAATPTPDGSFNVASLAGCDNGWCADVSMQCPDAELTWGSECGFLGVRLPLGTGLGIGVVECEASDLPHWARAEPGRLPVRVGEDSRRPPPLQ